MKLLASSKRWLGRLPGRRQATPAQVRRLMNIWPPLVFAGIRVQYYGPDWREARVRLGYHWWNRNYVGTQFGGSLFAMTDPFWMMMLMNRLGPGYVVWDRAAEIRFVSPGRGPVTAHFVLPDERVDAVRAAAAGGERHLEWFEVDVVTADGTVVARVRKQIYVKLKRTASLAAR